MAGKPGCNATHGMSKTPTYQSWRDMKLRCSSSKNKRYQHYKTLGIKVCDRWLESFDNFYADMGACPRGLTLDRIRGVDGYKPGNCRWASRALQAQNRTASGFVKMDWEKAAHMRELRARGWKYKALAREFGVSEGTVGFVLGWKIWACP